MTVTWDIVNVDVVWCRLLRTGVFRGKVAEREVAGSYPGQTNTHGVFCYDFYKWLDIRVFSDKDEKPKAPFHSSFTVLIFWDVKEPTLLFVKSRVRRPRWCGTTLNGMGG